MQPGHWALILLTARRSADPIQHAPDDAELAPIRPEAWAAWARAARPASPTERHPDLVEPASSRRAVGRSRWFRGALPR